MMKKMRFVEWFSILALTLSASFFAHADVTFPNGEWSDTVEELRVKVLGGYVRVDRQYIDGRWQITPKWNALVVTPNTGDGNIEQTELMRRAHAEKIARNGVSYDYTPTESWANANDLRTNIRFNLSIRRIPVDNPHEGSKTSSQPAGGVPLYVGTGQALSDAGYTWKDKSGNTIEYWWNGQILSYADRNNVTVWFDYSSNGDSERLSRVRDHYGRTVLVYSYDAQGRVQSITDSPSSLGFPAASQRRVLFAWNGDNQLIEVVDVLGNKTKYTYENKKLKSITDGENRTRSIDYGLSGRIEKLTEADGAETTYAYEYDKLKKQFFVRKTYPATTSVRKVEELLYDENGKNLRRTINGKIVSEQAYPDQRSTEFIDLGGNKTKIELDEYGNPTKQTYANGAYRQSSYSAVNGRVVEQTDESGFKTSFIYDNVGNLIKKVEAAGNPEQRITEYQINGFGYTEREQRSSNAATTATDIRYEYDDKGNLTRQIDSEGRASSYEYNITGNVVKSTDARGKVWTTRYDADEKIVQEENPLGNIVSYSYDKVGNTIGRTDARGKTFRYEYDVNNSLVRSIDAAGKVYTQQYDALGRIVKTVDESDVGSTAEYDPLDRPVGIKDGKGHVVQFAYGREDNAEETSPTRIIYPTYEKSFRYDGRQRLTHENVNNGSQTYSRQFAYDARGSTIQSVNPYDKSLRLAYDSFGRLIQTTDALGRLVKMAYDNRDNLIAIEDAKGNTFRFEYDRTNRLTKVTRPLGQVSTYRYEDGGLLSEFVDAKGQRFTYEYDDAGRHIKTQVSAPGGSLPGKTLTYAYDAAGNLVEWGDGVSAGSIAYDDNGFKAREEVNYGDGIVLAHGYSYWGNDNKKSLTYPSGLTVNFSFDSADRLESIEIPGEGSISVTEYNWLAPKTITLPGGTTQEFGHDGLLNVTAARVKSPGQQTISNLSNQYGKLLELKQQTLDDQSTSYQYDDGMRLTGIDHPGLFSPNTGYTLDLADNRTAEDGVALVYDANNRLVKRGTATYEYDANGNPTKRIENGIATHYEWDEFNRLVAVKDGSGGLIAEYGYDIFDRRLWKKVGGVVTYFHYGDEGLIAEVNAAGGTVAEYGWNPDSLWGTRPLWVKTAIGGSVQLAFYHHDHLGTPIKATDKDGNVVWSARYDAFGKATVATGGQLTNPLRLAGQYEDAETGLHYNWRRYYDPKLGRYLNEDPIGHAGGLNLYSYASHDPLNRIDPTGEIWPIIVYCLRATGICTALCSTVSKIVTDCWNVGDCLMNCGPCGGRGPGGKGGPGGRGGPGGKGGAGKGGKGGPGPGAGPGGPGAGAPGVGGNGNGKGGPGPGSSNGAGNGNGSGKNGGNGSGSSGSGNNGNNDGSGFPPDYRTNNAPEQRPPTGRPETIDHDKYNPRTGEHERSVVTYDQYGRQTNRTDYTTHGRPNDHTSPHHHTREYGPGYTPYKDSGVQPGPAPGHPETKP